MQLPPGSSLERTDKVVRQVNEIALSIPGMAHTSPTTGYDVTTATVAPNVGTIFTALPSLYNEHIPGVNAAKMMQTLRERLSVIKDANILVIQPPPVQGLGAAGGFKMMLEDRGGPGLDALAKATNDLVAAANRDKAFGGVFTLFNTGALVALCRCRSVEGGEAGAHPDRCLLNVCSCISAHSTSTTSTTSVAPTRCSPRPIRAFRRDPADVSRLKVRNAQGEMVPIGSVATFKDKTAPYRVPRYNLYPASEVMGQAAPGVASGTAMKRLAELAKQTLPAGIAFEWTDLSYQQEKQGTPTLLIFAAAALAVFLVLAAQYESWKTPLAIVLILPMCLLAASSGLHLRGMPIDILAQIGFMVLIGLAAKNAILIVEFAKQRQEEDGITAEEAAESAARTRLRPILMTSLAFIAGVAPLVVAHGAGSEMRQSLGTTVFFGMLGVTIFGLLFTPAFYAIARKLGTHTSSVSSAMLRKIANRSAA